MAQTMTQEEKKAAVNAAWTKYRQESMRISADRKLGWSEYLEAAQRLWSRFRAVETEMGVR